MREFISVHVGQAGVQIGNACWELFCLEHGIQPDGKLQGEKGSNAASSFFEEGSDQNYVPRSVFVDLDPTTIDQVRTGTYRRLFRPDSLLAGKEDSANNYARGRYTVGREILDVVLDQIRRLAQNCSSLQGILVFHSVGGGTGSGLGTRILENLAKDYGSKLKVGFTVFPSWAYSSAVVETYNSILSMPNLVDCCDMNVCFDNQAIYECFTNKLEADKPSFANLNRMIAQVVSSVTAPARFDGAMNVSLAELKEKVVPIGRLHFLTPSWSPLVSQEKAGKQPSVWDITDAVTDPGNTLVKFDQGKYIAGCVLFRGDVPPKDANEAFGQLKQKKTLSFVDWCPNQFKVGINYQPPIMVPGGDLAKTTRAACLIANHSGIKGLLKQQEKIFSKMYSKRPFVHWYSGEGMEEGEFGEGCELLLDLIKVYEQVELDTGKEEEEGQQAQQEDAPKTQNEEPPKEEAKRNDDKNDESQFIEAKIAKD